MRSPLLFALACVMLLAIALVALPGAPASAQESADVSLEQQIQAALANAGFDPGPADRNVGPKTRSAIRWWQWANGYDATGYLTTKEQLRSILTKAPPTATLAPKCAELPGQYLGEHHAECWEEVENQTGCFLWRTHYHSDQTTRWTGPCQSGVAEGHGTYSVSAGSEHLSYEGVGILVNGKANGRWVSSWSDGARFEGEYRDSQRNGLGTFDWPSGERYVGAYRDDMLNGFGILTTPYGAQYGGHWRDNKPHGYGTQITGDFVYEGEFRDGMRNGLGTCVWPNGDRYEGQWRDGAEHGFGVLTFPSGAKYEGQWRDDKPHGFGILIGRDGSRYQGTWRAGCFSDRNGQAAVAATWAECGF